MADPGTSETGSEAPARENAPSNILMLYNLKHSVNISCKIQLKYIRVK